MPATPITVTFPVTRSGIVMPTQNSDAANGNSLALTGTEFLILKNTDSGAHSVTFVAGVNSKNSRGQANPNITVSIPAGVTMIFGPFQLQDWQDSNGLLQMTWSGGTGTTVQIQSGQLLINNPASATEGSL